MPTATVRVASASRMRHSPPSSGAREEKPDGLACGFSHRGLVVCGAALGAMLFFAGVVAPLTFRTLPSDVAADFIRALFPVYYAVLMAVTAAAALSLWDRREAPVLAAVAVLFAFARWGLMPRINRARDLHLLGEAEEGKIFRRLHRLSVLINVAQMIALLGVFTHLAST
jgi:hypothetical protein